MILDTLVLKLLKAGLAPRPDLRLRTLLLPGAEDLSRQPFSPATAVVSRNDKVRPSRIP